MSGSVAISQRPEFARLADRLETGDVPALAKFDRLGRDAIDATATVAGLRRSTWTRSGTYGDRPRSGELAFVGFACKRVNAKVNREALQHHARIPLELAREERNQEALAMNSRRDRLRRGQNPATGTVRPACSCLKAHSRAVHGRLPAHFGPKGLKTASTVSNLESTIQTLPSAGLFMPLLGRGQNPPDRASEDLVIGSRSASADHIHTSARLMRTGFIRIPNEARRVAG